MELKNIGVTPVKEKQFNSKNIYSVEDLIEFFPRKYLDFRTPSNVSQVIDKEICSIVVTVYDIVDYGNRFTFKGKDINGNVLFVTYFGSEYIKNLIDVGDTIIFCGSVTVGFNRFVSMINPICFSKDIESMARIMPIYSKINGMSSDYFEKMMKVALLSSNKLDYLEQDIISRFGLMSKSEAIKTIHNPCNFENLKQAQERFLFDDIFYYNYELARNAKEESKESSFIFNSHELCSKYIAGLPFKLTEGQNEAIKTAYQKSCCGERINMLVQGDVGCGKTEIAKILLLNAVDNNYQGILLAPTTVLATQHYNDLLNSFKNLGVNIQLLTGDTKKKDRTEILKGVQNGTVNILVGTHAILSDDVIYNNLAITIVDEEHKFGVDQKEKLRKKGSEGVHSISLSATPIPRTLAMSIYGNAIDVITVTSRPNNRLPIATAIINDTTKAYEAIEELIIKTRQQAYIVCPVIDENDDVESVEDAYKSAKEYFEPLKITVGMINGRMKQAEISEIVDKFARHEFDILVSTTIIEVGVNVPNATFIMINSAERFGLSQLHQLRGRVGRGSAQSYCVLHPGVELTDENRELARKKLEIMTSTCNGFTIAEEDLKLRGTGDLIGTNQTGENKYILQMLANSSLDRKIKEVIKEIMEDEARKQHYDKFFRENK